MKLEDQVVSLDLARKLKELGAKQESLFWWVGNELFVSSKVALIDFNPSYEKTGFWTAEWNDEFANTSRGLPAISAFTVGELGEMLPGEISIGLVQGCGLTFMKIGNSWSLFTPQGFVIRDSSEADARATMLIHLIENKLLPTDEPSKKL